MAESDFEADEDYSRAIIIDNGSQTIFSGFSHDESPRSISDSLIATPNMNNIATVESGFCKTVSSKHIPDDIMNLISKYFIKEYYIEPDEIYTFKEIFHLKYPIQYGMITDFDALEKLWYYIIRYGLRCLPEEMCVFLNCRCGETKTSREKMTQSMFETMNVPSVYIGYREACALYATGRTSGCVVHCGHELTSAVPIYEGYIIPNNWRQSKIAGKNITNRLETLLKVKGCIYISSKWSTDIVNDIKEKTAYVTCEYGHEIHKCEPVSYILPDGNEIEIGSERVECTKVLFDGCRDIALDKMICEAIKSCDVDIRREMRVNICLSGGTSLLEALDDVLKVRVDRISQVSYNCRICATAAAERQYLSWIGASIVASMDSFDPFWITKDQYDESGAAIVHRKCW